MPIALGNAFIMTNTELHATEFDSNLSGTTVSTLLFHGNKIYSANSGDSRAIIVEKKKENLAVRQLTVDHKPDLDLE